jgi:hypothetical protein
MTPEQIEELIRLLQQGEEISPEWARILFPPEKKEYELVYYGKEREEDIIADTLPVPSLVNQKKYEYAQTHFERLNRWLKRERIDTLYQFNFLTPKSFNRFFIQFRKDEAIGFRSELDVSMGKNIKSA